MGNLLGREAILNAPDIETEDVAVPEWGGTVRVKGLTAGERDAYAESLLVGKGKNREVRMLDAHARLAAITIIDEDGNRLFSRNDIDALSAKSAAAIERVYDVAARLSGIEDEIEDLAGNSEPGQSGDSLSA